MSGSDPTARPESPGGPTLSTHVLDTGTGRPAAGVGVSVYRGDELVADASTDADGRVRDLAPGRLSPGTYRLVFDVAAYLGSRADGAFFRRVALDVELGADGHYHVPLLLSRYGVVSYRGS